MSWGSVDGANKYNVYFNDTYLATVTGNANVSYLHSPVVPGTHSYQIVAVNSDNVVEKRYSVKSDSVSVFIASEQSTDSSVAPIAPTNVEASVSGNTVTVTWSSVQGADKYNIYTNNIYRTTVVGNSATSYSHSNLANGEYAYYVVAVDNEKVEGKRYSEKSSIVSVTVGGNDNPSSPSNFRGTVYSKTALQLDWTQPSDSKHGGSATSFDIYRDNQLIMNTNNGNSLWLDNGLSAGRTYVFHIVAVYPDGAKSEKVGPLSLTMNQ